jgi:hypothetical protein
MNSYLITSSPKNLTSRTRQAALFSSTAFCCRCQPSCRIIYYRQLAFYYRIDQFRLNCARNSSPVMVSKAGFSASSTMIHLNGRLRRWYTTLLREREEENLVVHRVCLCTVQVLVLYREEQCRETGKYGALPHPALANSSMSSVAFHTFIGWHELVIAVIIRSGN